MALRSFLALSLAVSASAGVLLPALPQPAAVTARRTPSLALVLPQDSIGEIIVVEGGLNFLMLYQGLLTVRILLSWFPQAQSVALLRPVFTASDVYLNLFRGIVPPIGGIDISPIGAFFVLNLLTSSVASLGATEQPVTYVKRPLPGSRLLKSVRNALEPSPAAQ